MPNGPKELKYQIVRLFVPVPSPLFMLSFFKFGPIWSVIIFDQL